MSMECVALFFPFCSCENDAHPPPREVFQISPVPGRLARVTETCKGRHQELNKAAGCGLRLSWPLGTARDPEPLTQAASCCALRKPASA